MSRRRGVGISIASLCLLYLLPSGAQAQDDCSKLVPGRFDCAIQFAGVARTFNVFVPPSILPENPVPLVIDLHSFKGDPSGQAIASGWSLKAVQEGFIIAWPDGEGAWDAHGQCCLFQRERDDVGFIERVVSDISEGANINPDRVYATGLSNGGSMAHTLAEYREYRLRSGRTVEYGRRCPTGSPAADTASPTRTWTRNAPDAGSAGYRSETQRLPERNR